MDRFQALECSRLGLRSEQRVEADDRPGNFEDDESDLKGMESNVTENRRPDGVEDVVGGSSRIHPAHLVAGVRDKYQHGAQE